MRKTITILTSIILLAQTVFSQVTPEDTTSQKITKRPKIGLALSGGGAKGLAHIGVLEAIDSAGLKIDYITGTSMGAIVAAMYAAGYNGKQIRKIASNMDWMNAIMSSSARFEDMTIDAKDEYGNYIGEIPLEDWYKMKISTGFFEPQEVMLKLEEVFFPVYKIKDFTKLSIPFKCVATDLRNGSAVVLDKGDLAFATRSSMAIPGVFSATDYNGTKLVDGGVVRNFPVKDVIDMGADYVIGVNLFEGLTNPHDLTTMLDVMMQVMNFRDANDLVTEKSICDMVLEPDVSKYSAASFSSCNTILAIGDSIGHEFYPLFRQLADSLHSAYGVEYADTSRMRDYYETVRIDSFDVSGLKNTDKHLLLNNLMLKHGHYYTVLELNEAIRKAYTSQYYSKITYELIPTDEENGVCMKMKVDEIPMSFLNVGLSYNTFTGASLILGYTRKNLLFERSLTKFKIAISEAFRLRLNHRQYFGKNYNQYGEAIWDFSNFDVPIFNNRHKEALYDYRHNSISLTLGRISSKYSDHRIKMGYESFLLKSNVSKDTVTYDGRVNNFFVNLSRRKNTLNSKYLPQKGVCLNTDIYIAFKPKYKLDDFDYKRDNVYRITFDGAFYQPIGSRAALFENISASTSYGSKMLVHHTFLGGQHSFLPSHFTFIGLNTAQRNEATMAALKIGLQYKLIGELYGIIRANTAMVLKPLDAYIDNNEAIKVEDWIHGVGATVAYNLSFLPFDITLMYSPDYKFNVSVNVGFYF
ncbi:MAG: patatin-like phospholipase family protein [Bacteroidales bacterium]|nr:patatin-like phospholipase family protein [Bacteroidales bacterium]